MNRLVSRGFVWIYWVGLVLCLLSAIGVTTALLGHTQLLAPGVPAPLVIAIIYLLPVLIGWRIWVHQQAQRIAAAARVFDTEEKNV